jgi:O-antigen/teichoic acid export membrane protein
VVADAENKPRDLRGQTVRGALASTIAQVISIGLRTSSMVVLSRLLAPRDFGLVTMATAVTGFLLSFRDFGLATASVQRADITEEQLSTLFWLNLAVGAGLALLCVVAAPLLVHFYGEPQLLWITIALGSGFLVNGAAAQHRALLGRRMQFGLLAAIDTIALVLTVTAGIAMAASGFGYWAIVVMNVGPLAVSAIGVLMTVRWVPGLPRRRAGVRPLLKFGGTITLNSLIVYIAYNADKALIGRFWGAEALGIYSRAYQLINLPSDGLNSAISAVALPALARVQNDTDRLRRYFVQGYGVFLAVMVPLAVACALFSADIVRVFLGPKWVDATPVFRLLTPTMVVFALINPLSWMLFATARTTRSLAMACVIAPSAIVGYSVGLMWGPQGVAIGFSTAMVLLAAPMIMWARFKTSITAPDIVRTLYPAFVSALIGGSVAMLGTRFFAPIEPAFIRLCAECAVFFGAFALTFLLLIEDSSLYRRMWRDVNPFKKFGRSSEEPSQPAEVRLVSGSRSERLDD